MVKREMRAKSMFRGKRNETTSDMAKTFYLQGFDYKKPTKDSVQYPRLNDRAQTSNRLISRDNKAVFKSEDFQSRINAVKKNSFGGSVMDGSLPNVANSKLVQRNKRAFAQGLHQS